MHIGRLWLACFAAFSVLSLPAAPAIAHGRPPYVERIAFDPNDPDRIVLQFSFGLAVSEDAGATWRWICGSAYAIDPSWEDPEITITRDGGLILGTFATAMRGAPDLCTFEAPGGSIDDTAVLDLDADRNDPDVVWAVTSRGGGEEDRLQRTDDGGRTWRAVGDPFEPLLESVAVAPSDPNRVYLTAIVPATSAMARRLLLLRSDDRGESFREIEIAALDEERAPKIVGVDPTNADRIFVRMPRAPLDPVPERLLYSDDGGETFRVVHSLRQMRGFAISDDGRTVWAGSGIGDGVWVARDGTLDFVQVSTLRVRCLEARGEELWLCVDQIIDGFALGRSEDGGETVERVFELDWLEEFPECPKCSATSVICPFWKDDLALDFAQYLGTDAGWEPTDASIPVECLPDLGPLGRDAGLDAGVAFDGGAGSQAGCGCRVAPRRPSWGLALLFAMFSVVLVRRAR